MPPDAPARPVNLDAALQSFDQLWSPRILSRVNGQEVRVAKVQGVHVWHRHTETDELFLVVSGELVIGLRLDGAEHSVRLKVGDVFVVPRGTEHRPESAGGASIVLIEAANTLSTGDASGALPAHIDSTTGHAL
jgi:mannose-6-phosphate isomerase-like protein (cupin superfamily)